MKTANHNSTTLQSKSTGCGLHRFGLALALATCICGLQLAASAKTLVAGPALTQIAAGNTQVWGLDAGGNVYQYSKGTFNLIAGQNFRQIAVGLNDDVWGLGPKGHAFRWISGTTFSEVSPTFVFASIATGKGGTWTIDFKGRIYDYNSALNVFQRFVNPNGTAPPTATAIYVGGAAEAVWILDNGTPRMPHLYNTNTKFFDEVPGTSLQQIAVGYTHVWGLDISNEVREYVTTPTFEFQLAPSVLMTQLTITNDGELWAISDGDHAVYHYESKKFDLVDDSEDYVQITAGNSTIGVWALTNTHLIYKF